MHVTENYYDKSSEFDWDAFFTLKEGEDIFDKVDKSEILHNILNNFQENSYQITFCLYRMMDEIFQSTDILYPRILELGAATGFLSRFLIDRYNGTGVLVDQSPAAYKKFLVFAGHYKDKIRYLNEDIFKLDIKREFDLVCSFGLIEHFKSKKAVITVHKKFLCPNGYVLVLVPLDTVLSRVFFSIHPEINLGYRELLSQSELEGLLVDEGLEVIKTSISTDYCYDFVAALCKVA